ncbi:hypothetical protein ColLi_09200 [Colletotrichum liriopes]|uniref:Uncharacterized protein n=1 Tax=Colletotrichum liriopes TaxID=708192 RepID=A0AA37GSW7_9PEZI|nr:hypothetical protein ColLi_09200 [Colletotrichum liriopes]
MDADTGQGAAMLMSSPPSLPRMGGNTNLLADWDAETPVQHPHAGEALAARELGENDAGDDPLVPRSSWSWSGKSDIWPHNR